MTADPQQDWQAWHEARERRLSSPYGWLSLTALHWLTGVPATFPDLPGRWSASDGTVTVEADARDGLVLADAPIGPVATVKPPADGSGIEIRHGDRRIEVVRRGEAYAIRVRDPRSPTLAEFTGIPVYPFDPAWIIAGRFEAYAEPVTVTTGSSAGAHVTLTETAVGVVRFRVGADEHSLVAFDDEGDLWIVFRDAASTMRQLFATRPSDGQAVSLDFNRAANLPCAFTDFATCPMPLPENVLPMPIQAGERRPF